MMNTVNRIYSYIKICLQNQSNACMYIIYITEKGYPQPWLSAICTPLVMQHFAQAK